MKIIPNFFNKVKQILNIIWFKIGLHHFELKWAIIESIIES